MDEHQIKNRKNRITLSLHQPLQYTIQKIFEEGLELNLKPIIQSSTNIMKSNKSHKQNKMQLFYNAKLHNITITDIVDEPKTRMNHSVKILRTETKEDLNQRIQTLPIKNTTMKNSQVKRRRLKLRISVINQMMMYSEEQLQEKCIDIFRKLAKPIAGIPILEQSRLYQYLIQIFHNEQIAMKTVRYLQVPQSMNYKQYCDMIMGFNDWTKVDILFYSFYVFQENYSAILDSNSLFQLLTSEQCFSDDANFITKTLRQRQELNQRDNYNTYHTKLLKIPNLTFRRYKREQEIIIEKLRKQKLDMYQVKKKMMISNFKEHQFVDKEENIYKLPIQKDDDIIVTFETFKSIYSHSHPCFFGWLMKCLGDIDIYFIGQKL
ncbi:unnamed protein product [Paramecium primaurelia]|uniref:Uncharacterized protein n=1 Tax=Paramecium primaurelia TaxID=5886 RepID=A0A8S1LWC4_PARPR|nr:unnamed protein product [Paramecium primaurelia]